MKILYHVNKILLMTLIMLSVSALPCRARSMGIPGETEQEYETNATILRSDNEAEIAAYLDDQHASTRMTACMRLAEVGTTYSLPALEELAAFPNEPYDVVSEACMAIWKIRYRESGSCDMPLLVSILRDDGDKTKTARVKGWAMEILGDEGAMEAEEALKAIRGDETVTESSGYLKEKAEIALRKIAFIAGFPPNTGIMTIIDAGIAHESAVVKVWALNRLVRQNPDNLVSRLRQLFAEAQDEGDRDFMFRISLALQELGEPLAPPQEGGGNTTPPEETLPPEEADPPQGSEPPPDYPGDVNYPDYEDMYLDDGEYLDGSDYSG